MKLYRIKKSKIDNKGRGLYATKNITFSQYLIDIWVLDSIPAYKKELEFLRPLRISSDGSV